MGVGLLHHPGRAVRCPAWVLRGDPPGETRDREVKGSPKEMNRAHLTGEPGPVGGEYPVSVS
ncbi:MAG: hypothetical protein WD625_10235 [Balneolales bacterium]